MFYLNLKVNGKHVQAFVDCGAQNTILSSKCAKEIGIEDLIDTRFKGQAVGVGTSAIVGRIHCSQISISKTTVPAMLTILHSEQFDMLLGLDLMRRHGWILDAKNKCLKMGEDVVPFIPKDELKSDFGKTMQPIQRRMTR